jgi:hypothetical protein
MIKPIKYLVLFVLIFTHTAFAEPIITASTESVSVGEKVAPLSLINALFSSVDENDFALFSKCLTELHIKKSRRYEFFKAVILPRITQSEIVYFVRPALEPYCSTFYGSHVFRYWLIVENNTSSKKEYRILYAGIGDYCEVLPSKHNGYFDIMEKNCTAIRCVDRKMHYNGCEYKPFSCREITSINEGRDQIEKEVPCFH